MIFYAIPSCVLSMNYASSEPTSPKFPPMTPIIHVLRPSDAIALAVRVEAPIYCAQQVMEAAADLGLLKQRSDFDESEDLQKWLEGLKPDDFGKYKM
jgi:hypothetical protein